jgi:glycosyltransferase involved in cell wall biosynthesis
MKILYLNSSSQLGGAERHLIDSIVAVQKQDSAIEIAVLIAAPDGPLVTELMSLAVKVVLLELPPKIAQLGDSGAKAGGNKLAKMLRFAGKIALVGDLIAYRSRLRRKIVEIAPDLIHSNGMKTHLLAASLGLNLPLIWHLHDFISSRSLIKYLLKLFVGKVSMAIAISRAIADDWQAVFPQLPIELIYNAIDIYHFRSTVAESTIGKPDRQVKIGLIATYALWKGHDIFIQAIGQIAKQQPEFKGRVKFYIIGGAIYQTDRSQHSRTSLQQLACDAGVEDWLEFIDFQSNIVSSYNMLDIVVHASTQPEPFGRTIVEAMACEKAVIVSNAGGAAELFTHDRDALGIAPGDPGALAAAMLELIRSPAKRVAMGTAGRKTAIDKFDLDRLGREAISLYQKIL